MAGLVPAISLRDARPCHWNRDHRDSALARRPGDDVKKWKTPGGDDAVSWPGLVPAIPIPETRLVKQYYVYLIASRPGGALYVGVTNDLVRRIYEHKNGLVDGHTKRYRIDRLVHFEIYDSPNAAIQREKNIKHWPRSWKTKLIAGTNPSWRDLFPDIAS